ncbi:MAG: phospholipid carrier-dependent glycosyltransferase [Anaerolineae bacterium]|nr:phospholipid carrier-dependent glycosyltransferase [Anaerolineae bacterium]
MTRSNKPVLHLPRTLLLAVATILLGFLAFVFVAYAINLMQFPFDYDQGEGFELIDTIMFSRGEFPFRDSDVYPFYASNYPPLYHVIAAPFVPLAGSAYWYGRLLGFLATLIAAAAISYAVYRAGRNRWIALLAGLAFLASNTIYHVGPLFRQHMMMVMFETLAVILLAGVNEVANRTRRRWILLLGVLLLLAAGYTKQLAAFTVVAVFAWLFIRQPRRAVVWGIGFGVAAAGIFVWLNFATNGEWWRNVIAANINRYNLDQTIGLYRLWFSLHGLLIVPAALLVIYELYFDRISIYSAWFVVAIGVGAASGQWGAGDSYFATAIAAMCILSGIFAARTLRGEWAFSANYVSRALIFPLRRLAPVLLGAGAVGIPLIYLLYGAAVFHMPTQGALFGDLARVLNLRPNTDYAFYDSAGRIAGGYADIGHFTTQADIDAGWRIVDQVRSADGEVMSEDAGFSLMAGRQPVGNPTQLLNLWMNGLLDSSALIDMINAREFGLIIFRGQLYPVDVLQAIAANYERYETIQMNGFEYLLLRPRRP